MLEQGQNRLSELPPHVGPEQLLGRRPLESELEAIVKKVFKAPSS